MILESRTDISEDADVKHANANGAPEISTVDESAPVKERTEDLTEHSPAEKAFENGNEAAREGKVDNTSGEKIAQESSKGKPGDEARTAQEDDSNYLSGK